jgi:hypothetical protein
MRIIKIESSDEGWEQGLKRPFKFDPNSTQNEGRFRLRHPDDVEGYFRRKSSTPGVSYVMGKDSSGKSVVQAVRFDKKVMSEEQAASWWEKNKDRPQFAFSGATESKDENT